MAQSRRRFLHESLAAAGGLALAAASCTSSRERPLNGPDREVPATAPLEAGYLRLARGGQLRQIEETLWRQFDECRLCPRGCGANRSAGRVGVCGAGARLRVASYGPHFGEEPPLVGRSGSGTIFFSNCNLLCCFCQNWEINHRGDGSPVGHDELAAMMLELQRSGCHNINLVTPTHVVPHIVKALRHAVEGGLRVPLVYNTGGYDSLDVLQALDGLVDIYLPDFKYQDGTMAAKYSSGAADYPEVAAAGIREMNRQVGRLRTDGRGVAQRGLIIRHLVMPHNIAGTDRFVRWVARELGPDTCVNLMRQYRPEHRARQYPELSRRLTVDEWNQAVAWAREAGLTNFSS